MVLCQTALGSGFGRDGTPPSPLVTFLCQTALASGLWGLKQGIEKQQKQTNSNMSRVRAFGFSQPAIWTLGGPRLQRKTTRDANNKRHAYLQSTELWYWKFQNSTTSSKPQFQ